MKKAITIITCAGVLASLADSQAAEQPAKSAPALTASDRQTAEDQYLVPSPGDILGALQHSAKIDWKALSNQIEKSGADRKDSYAEDSQKALNLGMRVADSFVAVEARDKDQFVQFSGAVDKLATELSANANLAAKRDEAKKLVEEGKWQELGNLLEQVRFDVLREFKAVPDEDSIILANLGGWLRGLDLVTGALEQSYSAEGTKVLRQAGLVNYLTARLQKLEAPASTDKVVGIIKAKLPEIATLCSFNEDATLSQDKVKQLHEITAALVQAVQK